MLKWLSDNKKNIAICIFLVFVLFLGWNLWNVINHLGSSYMYMHSKDTNLTDATTMAEQWAIRGQMGDILSGHFSALAFLAVALSVYIQNQANRQMKKSIEQQDVIIQNQTKEFFISDMNVKLDRYYKLLDGYIDDVVSSNAINNYEDVKKAYNTGGHPDINRNKMTAVILTHNMIYKEINKLKAIYPEVYQGFIDEFHLKSANSYILFKIDGVYDKPNIRFEYDFKNMNNNI